MGSSPGRAPTDLSPILPARHGPAAGRILDSAVIDLLVKPLLRQCPQRERSYLAQIGLINAAECAHAHPSPAPLKDAVGQARDMFKAEGFSVIHEAA